jgi:cellulose synthase/poly-beta-1,6-N-acetylglucosamine synthase-like glycosyltransferase
MRKFIVKHDKTIQRLLEILPGFVSWNIILFPYWGIFVIPNVVAYFILLFNVYWFYQSLQIAITSIISHLKIQAAIKYNWVADLKSFPDWQKVRHIIIIPFVKEPLHILERTLNSLANQTLPRKQIVVVLATEGRVPEEERLPKINYLKKKYSKVFGNLLVSVHKLTPEETIGKHSNQRAAAIWFKKNYIDTKKFDLNYLTVTSCDSDHVFHPNHFAYLTFKFLDNPDRYQRFWQPAVMFYNNIWELPALTRVPNTLASIWDLSQLPRHDRLINAQNYSLSFKLLIQADYWDRDKIPEDWNIFFKAYFATRGKVEVEPIYLPLMADAAQSTSLLKTLKSQYEQQKRWAWGVSDDPTIIKKYFLTPDVPFFDKTYRVLYALYAHISWPVNWFLITVGLTLPTILNPAFGRTTLGYMVPKVSSFVLTIALLFLLVMIFIDNFYKPKRVGKVSALRALLTPFEFVLMPIAGFFFSALPGLDAHTRLMLGKYIEYRVTEKV